MERIKVNIECNVDNGLPEDLQTETEYRIGFVVIDDIRAWYKSQDNGSYIVFKGDDNSILVKETVEEIDELINRLPIKLFN